jgi:hypothetical protein
MTDWGISIIKAVIVISALQHFIRWLVNGSAYMNCQRPGSKPVLGVELEL